MHNQGFDAANPTQNNNPRQRVSAARSNDPRRVVVDGRSTRSEAAASSVRRSASSTREQANNPRTRSLSNNPRTASTSGVSRSSAQRGSSGSIGRIDAAPEGRERVRRTAERRTPSAYDRSNSGSYRERSQYASNGRNNQGPRPPWKIIAVALVIVLGLGGFGVYQVINPAEFQVTINGSPYTLTRGTTINNVIDQGLVEPKPGDLMAVDGTTLEAGGGKQFSATVNDEPTEDGETVLKKNNVITITDGESVCEPYAPAETVTIEPEYIVEGIGSIHHYVTGSAGTSEVRTGDISGKTDTVEVTPVVNYQFKSYNADVGDDKVIALTFDDGPWPTTTDQILDILDKYDVKATFFVLGQQIASHESSVKRAYEAGHQICSHTWDHADGSGQGVNLTYMSPEEQIAEITKSYEAIEAVTGEPASKVIRAPGGNYYGDIIWTLEPYVTAEIGWNVDTQDWSRPGAGTIADRIKSAKSGQIVLMHDGGGDRSQTVEALKEAIPYLLEKGYTFVTIDELLAYNDPITTPAGTTY